MCWSRVTAYLSRVEGLRVGIFPRIHELAYSPRRRRSRGSCRPSASRYEATPFGSSLRPCLQRRSLSSDPSSCPSSGRSRSLALDSDPPTGVGFPDTEICSLAPPVPDVAYRCAAYRRHPSAIQRSSVERRNISVRRGPRPSGTSTPRLTRERTPDCVSPRKAAALRQSSHGSSFHGVVIAARDWESRSCASLVIGFDPRKVARDSVCEVAGTSVSSPRR